MAKKEQNLNEKTAREKLQYIQSHLEVPKNQYNEFGKYHYRSCEDILEAVKPLLEETNLQLVIEDKIIQIGDRYYVAAIAHLSDGENSEIKSRAFAREQESKKGMDAAQITGSASSYARKYALNGLFAINDVNDPDDMNNKNNNQQPPKQQTEQPPKNRSKKPTQAQNKVLNNIIETIAPQLDGGLIVDIKKLQKAIVDKFGSLPSKEQSAETVVKYITEELGVANVSKENDFLRDLD